ncbi:MAG: addiction module protein [Alphaproteobacteria bacterium]|nr:addiction module protein [Alphaproteobacteria bacterium]
MDRNLSQLIEEALKLPSDARGALASRLIDSLDQATDPDAEAAWDAELARREEELDSGRARAVPWSEARQTILRARRP